MRSGYINLSLTAGALRHVTISGYVWSSRASSTRNDGTVIPSGYDFGFGTSATYPSHGPYERYFGNPLRCLSTVLDI